MYDRGLNIYHQGYHSEKIGNSFKSYKVPPNVK